MLKLKFVLSLFFVVLTFAACEKEYSVEGSGLAIFTFNGAPLACTGAVLSGEYKTGESLDSNHSVTITVNVSVPGYYEIATNTTDGITFSAFGSFTNTGTQPVNLIATGKPQVTGTYSFNTGTGSCSFDVIVTGDTAPGGDAVYTLKGAPDACTNAVIGGNYYTSTPLTAVNAVLVTANVTTTGAYTISTDTVNGFSFSATGTFTSTGPQSVKLNGTGTPAASGSFSFTPGLNGCSFFITVEPTTIPPVGDCKECSYFPTCEGSSYTFQDDNYISGSTVTTGIYSGVKDTTIDGKTYRKVITGGAASYYNCDGGELTAVAYNLVSVSGTQTLRALKMIMLKADAAVGATWTEEIDNADVTPPTQDIEYFYSIAEKGITWNVLGTDYNDVIRVHIVTSVIVPGFGSQVAGQTDYYFAKGIGVIEIVNKDADAEITYNSRKLKSYFIP